MDIKFGLKHLSSACFLKHEAIFAQVAPDPWVVLEEEGNVSGFLSSLAHSILSQGKKGSELCLPERSIMLQFLHTDAVLEYWQSAFEPKMPVIPFEGYGLDKAPCEDGQHFTDDMTTDKIVLLSFGQRLRRPHREDSDSNMRLRFQQGGWP